MLVGERTLELYLAPFSDQASGGVLVVLHDVTEQHRNEERRKEFVANVSHELRTPLTNVRSYAETLRDSGGDIPRETEDNFLDIIINETDRMTHIVQDLLTLSRFDSGRTDLKLTQFSFSAVLHDLYNAVYMEAQRHSHALELKIEPELPEIVADRERVVQVMMNIVSNSIKYTPDGGRIVISAGRRGDGCGCWWMTTASASRRRTGPASSSGFIGWTRPGPASRRDRTGPVHRQGDHRPAPGRAGAGRQGGPGTGGADGAEDRGAGP